MNKIISVGHTMNLFLDTNVMVGYVFETDNWNSKSIEVFLHNAPKYSCPYAFTECGHLYKSKLRKSLRELRRFQKKLRSSKSYGEIETYIETENFVTGNVLSKFIEINKNVDLQNMLNLFSILSVKMEKRCHNNYDYISKNIKLHESRHPHKDLAYALETCGLLEEDADDVEIIIDAHDLGLMIKNMLFITGDYEHIVSRKDHLIQITSLSDVIGLFELT